MTTEPLVIDHDPAPDGRGSDVPVVLELPDVPPRAISSGWGGMSWLKS